MKPIRLRVGVVDVFVVQLAPRTKSWRVLALRRAAGERCAASWETVHGHIERGETPEEAAVRELREEAGLAPERLYNVTTHAFYLHRTTTVEVAVVFCAFIAPGATVTLGHEHDRYEWLPRSAAMRRFVWPHEGECLARAHALLAPGHAGVVEDVMRVSLPDPPPAGRARQGRSA